MDITYSFMLPIVQYFAKVTHSYGWAIVLLTLLVRVLVWPLVSQSTRSMQRLSQLQPKIKELQERYKDDPQLFQQKAMEFYSKNKVNPMGGCLPTLIQLPILIALYATFAGPPFGDKIINVPVNVVEQKPGIQLKKDEASKDNSPYVSKEGVLSKIVVFPGEMTIAEGEKVNFGTRAIDGQQPADFKPDWGVLNKDSKPAPPEEAVIDAEGHAEFKKAGNYRVTGHVHGVAHNEPFLFVTSLGKVVAGADLLKPQNFDSLGLILLFGITMYISQKLTMPTAKKDPSQMDENELVQYRTSQLMPVMITGTFLFVPLPTGVYVYFVLSNIVQTLQTALLMRMPAPPLVDVTGDDPPPSSSSKADGTKRKADGPNTDGPKSDKPKSNGSKPSGSTGEIDGHKIQVDGQKIQLPDAKKKKKKR